MEVFIVFALFLGGVLVYIVLRNLFPSYQELLRWGEKPISKTVQVGSATSWDPEVIVENVRAQMGYTKGGMYAGITVIPGDPNKSWVEGKDSIYDCPVCDGVMRNIYQGAGYEQDGEEIRYYKEVCKDCNFLNDAGRKMTKREARASKYVYCGVVKGKTFNRTGHSCDFIDPEINEPVTRMDNWCEECPHPH